MKFIQYVKFIPELEKVAELRPSHREHLKQIFAEGKLLASGPFADLTGALFIYEAHSLDEVKKVAEADPYAKGKVLASSEITEWKLLLANSDGLRPQS